MHDQERYSDLSLMRNLSLQWLVGDSERGQACIPLGNTVRGVPLSSHG